MLGVAENPDDANVRTGRTVAAGSQRLDIALDPAAGQVNTVHYITPAEAVGAIEELGWFAGAAAGAGAGTGIMISRVLYSRVKTNLESLQIERLDTLEKA